MLLNELFELSWRLIAIATLACILPLQLKAQDGYDVRLIVVDLKSYAADLKKLGSLEELQTTFKAGKLYSDDKLAKTEQVIANVVARSHVPHTLVAFASDTALSIPIDGKDIEGSWQQVRKFTLTRVLSPKEKKNPSIVKPANVTELLESLDDKLAPLDSEIRTKKLRDAEAADPSSATSSGAADDTENAPHIHVVWIGRNWTMNYADAEGRMKFHLAAQEKEFDDACFASELAKPKIETNTLPEDWEVDFELHLVDGQKPPSLGVVKSLMHRLTGIEYKDEDGDKKFETYSKARFLGTFLPGCAVEPPLENTLASADMSDKGGLGQCSVTAGGARDRRYEIRCDEHDASDRASITEDSWKNTAPGSTSMRAKAEIAAIQSKPDLFFLTPGYERHEIAGGSSNSISLSSWAAPLAPGAKVHVYLKLKTHEICGENAPSALGLEFEITGSKFKENGFLAAKIRGLPCHQAGARPFIIMQIFVLEVI